MHSRAMGVIDPEDAMQRLAATLAIALIAGAAQAQVYYGGYDLGPDYGAMLQDALRRQEAMNRQMREQEAAIVRQAMQSPDCQLKYRQHLAAGGAMPFAQFAWQYAATAGMTAEGAARFMRSERANQMNEMEAWQGWRQAQDARAAAQADHAAGYARNQAEVGQVLQGNTSWIDPADGQTRALPYIGPGGYTDPATGRSYARDAQGRYWTLGSDGLWYAMTPAR